MKMQPGRWLIQDVQRAPGIALGKLQGQLDALGFTARQGGGALPQRDVAETYIQHGLQFASDDGYRLEKLVCMFYSHLQNLVYVSSFILYFQSFRL